MILALVRSLHEKLLEILQKLNLSLLIIPRRIESTQNLLESFFIVGDDPEKRLESVKLGSVDLHVPSNMLAACHLI